MGASFSLLFDFVLRPNFHQIFAIIKLIPSKSISRDSWASIASDDIFKTAQLLIFQCDRDGIGSIASTRVLKYNTFFLSLFFLFLNGTNCRTVLTQGLTEHSLSRYTSPIIDVRVGTSCLSYPVHKDILTKSEYFSKALDGQFRESKSQSIDLPEEDPDIFGFVIAFLYEGKFVPIRSLATVLGKSLSFAIQKCSANSKVAEPDKGKGREQNQDTESASDEATDSGGNGSDER